MGGSPTWRQVKDMARKAGILDEINALEDEYDEVTQMIDEGLKRIKARWKNIYESHDTSNGMEIPLTNAKLILSLEPTAHQQADRYWTLHSDELRTIRV